MALPAVPDFSAFVSREEAIVVSITASVVLDERHPRDDDAAGRRDGGPGPAFEPAGLRQQLRTLASGFIIADHGQILTSARAVEGVDEMVVRLADGRQFNARTLGLDKRSDVALIKIAAAGLPVATIGDPARLQVGDWVAAIGAPFGLEASVTAGIVSAKQRYIEGDGGVPFIQTDVAINRGSSGGPLFNLQGEVVGINSMIYSDSGGYMGVSFTLPIDIAMAEVGELRDHGHVIRAQLGAQVQALTSELARSFGRGSAAGALIVRVQKQGAAEQAGIRRGDVVLGIGESSDASCAEVQQRVAAARPGQALMFNIRRPGRVERVPVTLVEAPFESPAVAARQPAGNAERLGLVMSELGAEERALMKTEASLWVRQAHGPALRADVRSDDFVVAVNDTPIARLAEFDAALAGVPPGRPVALLIVRAGVYGCLAITPGGEVIEPWRRHAPVPLAMTLICVKAARRATPKVPVMCNSPAHAGKGSAAMSHWLVLANESRARILEKSDPRLGNYVHVVDLVYSQPPTAFNAMASRVESSGHGIEGATFEALAETAAHGDPDFAREIAARLDEAIAASHCAELILVAEQPFLGRLCRQLGGAARGAIRLCEPGDFTRLNDSDIALRLRRIDEDRESGFRPSQLGVHRAQRGSSRDRARPD